MEPKAPSINIDSLTSAPSSENSCISLYVSSPSPIIFLKTAPSGVISSPFLNKSLTSLNNLCAYSVTLSACFCTFCAKAFAALFVSSKLFRAVFISFGTLCLLIATKAPVPKIASAATPTIIAAVFLLFLLTSLATSCTACGSVAVCFVVLKLVLKLENGPTD